MELKQPSNDSILTYSRKLARESIPLGANQHKIQKSRIWRTTRPRRPIEAYFNMVGPCRGDREEVVKLGLKLTEEAIERGDKEEAERILNRVKEI